MGQIRLLPPELINQIAAGEVIERPASVVKELVENAIDAGATRIEIQIREGGQSIRVSDNGHGMHAEDLQVAFKNHATSKVRTSDDLFRLSTLGFRGEALASIAAISKVTCTSRPADATVAIKATVASSGDVTLQETGAAPGTTFEISDLFYNVPARLKFMKRPQTELAHIQEMVQLLALSHPEIAFTLKLDDANSVKTSGGGKLEKTLHEVYSIHDNEPLLPFSLEDPEFGYRVSGFTAAPHVTRGSKKWISTFVNGRGIRCPILGKAIETAYQGLMTPGKYPITALFLSIPPDEIDVNVHPAKREIRYERANTLFSFVRGALAQALQLAVSQSSDAGLTQTTSLYPKLGYASSSQSFSKNPTNGTSSLGGGYSSHSPGGFQPINRPASEAQQQAALSLYAPIAEPSDYLPQVLPYRIIGQFAKTYILLDQEDGLLVVDQHIAGERVLYERFYDEAEKAEPASQQLLVPKTFPISATVADCLEQTRDDFAKLGFTYTLEGELVSFHTVPSFYTPRHLQASLEGLLSHLEETGQVHLSLTDVIATAACHSAVRAGDILNMEQMQRVIEPWLSCERPWTCPHGRPVSYLIPHKDIMAFFERPSLPQR